MTLWTKRITIQSVFCPSYRKFMREPCIISCLSFLTIFSIPIWSLLWRLWMSVYLLYLLEDWRKALDNHQFAAAILMDLSKAFDCLPHDLLIEKLRAYGLAPDAVSLLSSYLSDRVQKVRLGSHNSTWEKIIKGVPQGSILGPLLFNVIINDIFILCNKQLFTTKQMTIPYLLFITI